MLVRICTYSASKLARFLASLALAYIFDGRYSKSLTIIFTIFKIIHFSIYKCLSLDFDLIYLHSLDDRPKRTSKSVCSAKVRTSALKCIESFIKNFKVPQIFASAASSTTPSMLAQVSEKLRIPGADNLRCSGEEIGRIVTMLQNPSPELKNFAAFALLQVFF